jgi:hypothetical protein
LYITRISRVAHNSKQVISNNEETPVTSLFRGSSEEFSYENVNLYKGKLAFLVSTILNAYINKCLSVVLLLIIVIYKINVYELCRFSKTFLKFQINYFIIR